MKKLLLIQPSINGGKPYGSEMPPLGLAYIAAVTPKTWDIRIIDEHLEQIDFEQKADLVGITSYTRNVNRAYDICTNFQKHGRIVVMGGFHASACPEEALCFANAVVVGEAEPVWPKLISDFESGNLQKLYLSTQFSLDNLVMPRRDLISDRYGLDVIQTSRGCAYNCEFCSVNSFFKNIYRQRPVEKVIEELKTIKNKVVYFLDDNFMGSGKKGQERAFAFFKEMEKKKVKKYWGTQASLEIADNPELLKSAYKSGCRGVFIGMESIEPANLEVMKKHINLKRGIEGIRRAVKKIQNNGIAVVGMFIFGNDYDDSTIFSRTLEYAENIGLDSVEGQILTPYPATPLFNRLKHEKRLIQNNFPEDWEKIETKLMFKPLRMTEEELYKGIDFFYQNHYSKRPIFIQIMRTLMRTKNITAASFIYFWLKGVTPNVGK